MYDAVAHAHEAASTWVVNNAGYGLFGSIEEVSEEQARAQIETNLFGALWALVEITDDRGHGSDS